MMYPVFIDKLLGRPRWFQFMDLACPKIRKKGVGDSECLDYDLCMIKRNIVLPEGSFFLFGPRGSDKSYWLRNAYAQDVAHNIRQRGRLCVVWR